MDELPETGDVLRVKGTKDRPDSGGEVVVKQVADETAGEYVIPGLEKTVAEYNDCDPNEAVIEAVYSGESLGTPQTYAFPESRLTVPKERDEVDEVLGA